MLALAGMAERRVSLREVLSVLGRSSRNRPVSTVPAATDSTTLFENSASLRVSGLPGATTRRSTDCPVPMVAPSVLQLASSAADTRMRIQYTDATVANVEPASAPPDVVRVEVAQSVGTVHAMRPDMANVALPYKVLSTKPLNAVHAEPFQYS